MSENLTSYWKKCSACKKEIPLRGKYYVCSVSTCNGIRTGYVFCSVNCFERHLPGARHKDAAAIEKWADAFPAHAADERSPTGSSAGPTVPEPRAQQRILIRPTPASTSSTISAGGRVLPKEVLVIASRFKEYVAAKADMNTSGAVMDIVSDYLRVIADRAIDEARAQGRKTLMDRDFDFLKKS